MREKLTNDCLKLFWLDGWPWVDRLLALYAFLLVILIVYGGRHSFPASQAIQLYSVLASTAGTGLGFVIAALTLLVGFIPSIAGQFNKTTLSKLNRAFKQSFKWAIIAILIALCGMIFPVRLMLALVTATSTYFFSTLFRTVFLLFRINEGVIDNMVEQAIEQAIDAEDAGPLNLTSTFNTPNSVDEDV